MLQSTKKKFILPLIAFLLLGVGTLATFILVKSNQDIRQQASGECSVGDPYCSCDINERCVKVDPDGTRVAVEQGGEENDKGILATSFTGNRPSSEGGCGGSSGVWQNDFCYMPGDELTGGYIVVESGRYSYPHFEKKETYESLGYGAETVTGKMGSEKDLGSDCGGEGLAVDGTCYTYGSTINGYLVMPSRDSDCDNAERDYCYAHLKKIKTEYDGWQSAVEAYEATGDYSQLEKLYKDNYGIAFEVGGLFDPNADNADILKAQSLIAALTNADVLQAKAAEQNAALDEKIKNGETLTEAEQAVYDFNRDIVADENFDKRYFYLDELSASTVEQTTMNQAVQEMYVDLVVIGSDGELDEAASEKFKEIFGYDPAEKYGETKGILEALGIDYSRFEQDRTIYANELKKQQEAQQQAEEAQQQTTAQQQESLGSTLPPQIVQSQQATQQALTEEGMEERKLLDDYYNNPTDPNVLNKLYVFYTGTQTPYRMTSDEISKELSKYSSQIALQTYLNTGDIDYLKENYVRGKSLAEITNSGVLNDEKSILQGIFGRDIGLDIYKNAVLPTLAGDALNNFAQDPDQLESICSSTLGSSCNLSDTNVTKLGEFFEVVYEGRDVNIEEMTVAYSNQLLAVAEEEKKESFWDVVLNSIAMGMSGDSMAMASLTSDTMKEHYEEQIDYQSEVMANYSLAIETSQIFDAQNTFAYANQADVRENLSDYTWGTSLGNAVMYDNVFDREYDLQDDLGLSGLDAASLTWNQVKTQGFNVTNTVENIATNYAISAQTGYTGPANTNIADLVLQSAQNLDVLDYDYQEAQAGHYFKQGASNVGATITDWAVTAGTYTSLAMQAANENTVPYAYAATTVAPDVDYAEIANEAKEAGDAAAAAVRQNAAESLVEQHNQQVETKADEIDLDQYVTFQMDEEIVRSRQELNWETVEKVVAPAAAVVVLPIAVASGAGIGVIAGVSSSAFSLYQGAGQKAQALELERVVISEDMDDRKNVAALAMVKYSPDPITYEEAIVDVEEQVDMLNKQGNIMVASSAVAALTSGAGIVNGFAQGGQAAMATGQSVNAVQQLAINSGRVAQTMSAAGRVGGIGLSSYNAINSGQQAIAAADTLSGLDEAVANGDMTEAEAAAMRGNLKGQVAMSGLSSFVAASGVVGNTFGFIRNPSLQTQAITTRTDLILDIMNVPAGVAVDAQNVSQSCFNQSYPSGEGDCRDAWIGLALSVTQDVAQVRNSTSSFKNYQYDQLTTQGQVGDFSQRISLLDVEMRTLLDNPQRTFSDTLKLGELQIARQELADAALKLSPGLVIPDLVRPVAAVNVDTQKILDTAEQNRATLNTRANEVEGDDPTLAAKLRQDADDNWNHQAGILKINQDIANIDAEISQRSAELSALDIEGLRGRRDGLVNELEGRVKDQNFKAANLDLDNKQLLAAAKVNAAFATYDSDQRANNQAGVGIERNLSPPDTADIKKRTGLASLLPGSAEQNKALDLASLQTKILEAEDLNTRRIQVEQDLEKFIGIDPNDHMVEILRTELADITQKIIQANQVVDQVTKSIGGPPSIWQRLTAGLPSQKTAQDYDQAMLAMRDMSSLRQEMDAAVRDIEKLSTQNSLSEGDQRQLDTLSRRLREASIEYDAAEGVVKGVYDRAQIALAPQASKNKVAAFFTKTFGGLGGILPSRSKKAVVTQRDFDSSYESAETEAQRVQVRQEVKSQLADAKDSYDELTRNQNEIKKSDSEIARLEQELADLEKQTEPLSTEQSDRKTAIPGEIVAIEDVKKIFYNSIGRLEDKLLKPILSADVSERLIEAQQKGNFDEVLGTIRTEELDRLAENRLGLSSRQDFIIEDLLKIKSGITNSSSAEDLVTQRDLYNQKLSELSESILGDSPEAANYQKLSDAQQFLKNMDVLTAARAARAEGDHDGAVDILSSREASIPVEDPILAARLGTIVRDAEFRTGASEGIEFFNARTNQMDTFLKILEGERVAIELTTAGGKTFVGSVLLRAQTELLGYNTGIYIAKPGQEADIQTSMMKAYGASEEEIVILDSTRLSEADYLSTLLASRFVVADPSNLQFIRNSANNFKDPNFKVANDVYRKLTQNTSLYIDELQINLDPSRQAINSVGASSEDIPDAYKDSARLVGEALGDTLLRNGGWGLGDNDFLVLRTEEGAEIAKFNEAAQKDIFAALAQKMGISATDYGEIAKNAPELERAFNQDTEVLKQKLATLGVNISPPDVERIFDQIDMMNTFAQGLKMKAGTDYQRMIDDVLANNGGPNRPVTVPAAGAVANEGQSYTAKLQAAMEYIGARANNEDPNFDGLTSSPNLAFKSTIADYLGDLRNSSVGAVTGALADGRGVAETALGLVTYRSTEAVEKILSIEGSSTGERINVERSYQVSRSGDVDALVALKLSGKLNQSAGEDANGNLKVVMGFDGAKNPLDFAIEMAKSGAFAGSEFAVQNADGSYSLIKLSPSGEVLSTKDIDTKAIQDLYNDRQNPAQNLVTIIGRGGATGDSIKTAKNVPGVTVTSFDAPEGLVAQAGARIDRGSDIADQYALIINRDAQPLNINKPADFLKVAQMTESDFTAFRNRVTEVQKIVEQSKNTQALDQGVIAASTRVLSDLIRNSTDPEIQKWASSKLLEFYSETTTRDLDLKGGAQESLLARQKKISAQVDGWERLLADRANSNILDTIKKSHPDLYAQMRSNVNANDQKLAYAQGEVLGKESVMTAANLADFVDKHNKYVVADSENKYVADSGRPPIVDQIATDTQRNSVATGKARARIAQVIDSVKGLKNISINISNPLASVPGLVGQIRGTQFAQNVSRLPGNIQTWSTDVREVQRNQRILYAGQVAQLEGLNDQLAAEDDIADRAKIIEKIAQIREEMGEVGRVAKASVTLANLFKDVDFEKGGAFRIPLRRSSKTNVSETDEKALAEGVRFALSKAWERIKNPTTEAESQSGERTRMENLRFALAKAWVTRVVPGASSMGERLIALLNIAPKEIRDKRAQIIADFGIADPGLKAEISTYKTVEKLDAFVRARNIAYGLLRDQFASLNTKPDSGIQNEKSYKDQTKKLKEVVVEIEELQVKSELSFALTQDGQLQQDELGKYTRVNKDQFKTLSEFKTKANSEIARLEKDKLEAEAQAEEQRLADEARLEKERLAQVEADRLAALKLDEAQQQATKQLATVRNSAIGGLGAESGSEIWEKINTAKDESEIDVIVAERRLKYQYVKDQLRALGTTAAAINNEADYQAQQNRMLEIVEEIETLERKSGLEFLTIDDDSNEIPVVRIDQNKNLSTFRAEAEREIARLEQAQGERDNNANEQLSQDKSFTISSLDISEDSDLYRLVNSAETIEELQSIIARRKSDYEELSNQFFILGISIETIGNEIKYAHELSHLESVIERIVELQKKSGLNMLEVGENGQVTKREDGFYVISLIDESQSFSNFVIAAEAEIEKLAEAEKEAEFDRQAEERERAKSERIRRLEADFGITIKSIETLGKLVPQNLSLSQLKERLKEMQKLAVLVITNEDDINIIGYDSKQLLQSLGTLAESFYEVVRQKEEEVEKTRVPQQRKNIFRVGWARKSNQDNLGSLKKKINKVQSVKGQLTDLLWTHNTSFSSLSAIFGSGGFSALTNRGRQYIQEKGITEDEFWQGMNDGDMKVYRQLGYVKRGFNARYGLSSDYGDIKFVFKPGFEQNYDRGINNSNKLTSGAYASDFFSLNHLQYDSQYSHDGNKYAPKGEFNKAGFLRRKAQEYDFNSHLDQNIEGGAAPSKGVLERPYLNPQLQVAGAVSLDDVQAVLVPEHLYDETVRQARHHGFDVSKIVKVETGKEEGYYAYDSRKDRPSRETDQKKKKAVADGVMRPYQVGYVTGSSVNMVTSKKAFEKEQQAYLELMLNSHAKAIADERSHYDDEFLFNLLVEEISNKSVVVDLSKYSLSKRLRVKLANLYRTGARVWEGYSVKEHTRMVYAQFAKYIAPNLSQSQTNFYTILIALHDIGKPIERDNKLPAHSATVKIARKVLRSLGYEESVVTRLSAAINQDFIGDYIKGNRSYEQTLEGIKKRAEFYGQDYLQYFEDIYVLYFSDAAAYTVDAGGFKSLDERAFDVEKLRSGQGLALNAQNVKKVNRLKSAIESLSGKSTNGAFKNLCSSCEEVRKQTKVGLEEANALLAAGNTKQALAQINKTRKEVVNAHGMQNQCVQLYLNAWVDTREAEIRQTTPDVNKAIDSVYKATVIADGLLEAREMRVVEKKGFLGIGVKTRIEPLMAEDIADIKALKDGGGDTPGLKEMAEFERNEDGGFDKRQVIGGTLYDLQEQITKGYIFDLGNLFRVWGRSVDTAWRQRFIEGEITSYERYKPAITNDIKDTLVEVIQRARETGGRVGFQHVVGEGNSWYVFDPQTNELTETGRVSGSNEEMQRWFGEVLEDLTNQDIFKEIEESDLQFDLSKPPHEYTEFTFEEVQQAVKIISNKSEVPEAFIHKYLNISELEFLEVWNQDASDYFTNRHTIWMMVLYERAKADNPQHTAWYQFAEQMLSDMGGVPPNDKNRATSSSRKSNGEVIGTASFNIGFAARAFSYGNIGQLSFLSVVIHEAGHIFWEKYRESPPELRQQLLEMYPLPEEFKTATVEKVVDIERSLAVYFIEEDAQILKQEFLNQAGINQEVWTEELSDLYWGRYKNPGDKPTLRSIASIVDLKHVAEDQSFNDLCSSCSLVRNQTEEGLQQADAKMEENISKRELARANRLLAEAPDLEGGEDKAKELELEAKNLEREAEELKQQALAQIDKTRKEVVNAHGMQNRFIQLYLNAQVDADEAEIRKTKPDVDKAIDSAYQATVEAEDLLAAGEMVVVTQKGFLGIGRKTQTIRLTADDLADVRALKDGGGDTPGLVKIVEFERKADGSLNRKKTIGGVLHELQKKITRGYIFDIGPRLRVLGRSVDTAWRQRLGREDDQVREEQQPAVDQVEKQPQSSNIEAQTQSYIKKLSELGLPKETIDLDLLAQRLATLKIHGQHDDQDVLQAAQQITPEDSSFHLAALIHDIGKTGPPNINQEGAKVMSEVQNLAHDLDIQAAIPRIFSITGVKGIDKQTTIQEFLKQSQEQRKITHDENQQLTLLLGKITNPFTLQFFNPVTDTMADLWDSHTLWGVQLLRQAGVNQEIIDTVAQHHRIDVYADNSLVLYIDTDQETIIRIPANQATDLHKSTTPQGRLLLALDKYSAFIERGGLSPEEAIQVVIAIIEKSAISSQNFKNEIDQIINITQPNRNKAGEVTIQEEVSESEKIENDSQSNRPSGVIRLIWNRVVSWFNNLKNQDSANQETDAVQDSLEEVADSYKPNDCTNCLIFTRTLRNLLTKARASANFGHIDTMVKNLEAAQNIVDSHSRQNLIVQQTAEAQLETVEALLALEVENYGILEGERSQLDQAATEIQEAIVQIERDKDRTLQNQSIDGSAVEQFDTLQDSLRDMQAQIDQEIEKIDSQRLNFIGRRKFSKVKPKSLTPEYLQTFFTGQISTGPRSTYAQITGKGIKQGESVEPRRDAWIVGSSKSPVALITRTRSTGLITIKLNRNVILDERPDARESIEKALDKLKKQFPEGLALSLNTSELLQPILQDQDFSLDFSSRRFSWDPDGEIHGRTEEFDKAIQEIAKSQQTETSLAAIIEELIAEYGTDFSNYSEELQQAVADQLYDDLVSRDLSISSEYAQYQIDITAGQIARGIIDAHNSWRGHVDFVIAQEIRSQIESHNYTDWKRVKELIDVNSNSLLFPQHPALTSSITNTLISSLTSAESIKDTFNSQTFNLLSILESYAFSELEISSILRSIWNNIELSPALQEWIELRASTGESTTADEVDSLLPLLDLPAELSAHPEITPQLQIALEQAVSIQRAESWHFTEGTPPYIREVNLRLDDLENKAIERINNLEDLPGVHLDEMIVEEVILNIQGLRSEFAGYPTNIDRQLSLIDWLVSDNHQFGISNQDKSYGWFLNEGIFIDSIPISKKRNPHYTALPRTNPTLYASIIETGLFSKTHTLSITDEAGNILVSIILPEEIRTDEIIGEDIQTKTWKEKLWIPVSLGATLGGVIGGLIQAIPQGIPTQPVDPFQKPPVEHVKILSEEELTQTPSQQGSIDEREYELAPTQDQSQPDQTLETEEENLVSDVDTDTRSISGNQEEAVETTTAAVEEEAVTISSFDLQGSLDTISQSAPGDWGIMIKQVGSDTTYSINADQTLHPASTIKIPIAIAVFNWAEQEGVSVDELLSMHPKDSWRNVERLLNDMLINSEEEATEILSQFVEDQAGYSLKSIFNSWGAEDTSVYPRRATAADFTLILEKLHTGDLGISQEATDVIFSVIRTDSKDDYKRIGGPLPADIRENMAHKVGTILGGPGELYIVSDTGTITLPSGEVLIIVALGDIGEKEAYNESVVTIQSVSDAALQEFMPSYHEERVQQNASPTVFIDEHHSNVGRLHNLLEVGERLDGLVIPAGATVDLAEYAFTQTYEYMNGYAYNGSDGVSFGGGMCGAASALARAAENLGLEWQSDARHYPTDHAPGGLYENLPNASFSQGKSLTFTNTSGQDMVIQISSNYDASDIAGLGEWDTYINSTEVIGESEFTFTATFEPVVTGSSTDTSETAASDTVVETQTDEVSQQESQPSTLQETVTPAKPFELQPTATANYTQNEYHDSVRGNMQIATQIVNNHFSEPQNFLSADNPHFSYLEVMDHFQGKEWQLTNSLRGAGACDIATLMYRAAMEFSSSLGIEGVVVERDQWGHDIVDAGIFTIRKIDHSEYTGKPDDEIAVASVSPTNQWNSNFEISFKEGIDIPEDLRITIRIVEDASGNFTAEIVSNYSTAALQDLLSEHQASVDGGKSAFAGMGVLLTTISNKLGITSKISSAIDFVKERVSSSNSRVKVSKQRATVTENLEGQGIEILSQEQKSLSRKLRRKYKKEFTFVDQTRDLLSTVSGLSDEDLARKTQEFKSRIDSGENLDDLLPEITAVFYEATHRSSDQLISPSKRAQFPDGFQLTNSQLMAAFNAINGNLVELPTGLGKTVVSAFTAYTLSLSNSSGSHIATANTLLAEEQALEMSSIYSRLGIKVGYITEDDKGTQEAYLVSNQKPQRTNPNQIYSQATIIYSTISRFGFDHMLKYRQFNSQQALTIDISNTAIIIDEADSILVDEATTPLVLAKPVEFDNTHLIQTAQAFKQLLEEQDEKMVGNRWWIDVEEPNNQAILTQRGIEKLSRIMGVDLSLADDQTTSYSPQQEAYLFAIDAVLTAHYQYIEPDSISDLTEPSKPKYIIIDDQIVLIDQNTGKTLPGRRLSNGIHQALEALNELPIQGETISLDYITVPQLVHGYGSMTGMSATLQPVKEEIETVYQKQIRDIPPPWEVEAAKTDTNLVRVKKDMQYTQNYSTKGYIDTKTGQEYWERVDLSDRIFFNQSMLWDKLMSQLDTPNRQNPVLVIADSVSQLREMHRELSSSGQRVQLITPEMSNEEIDERLSLAGQSDMITLSTSILSRGANIKLDETARKAGGLHVIGVGKQNQRVTSQILGRAARFGDPGSSQVFWSLTDASILPFRISHNVEQIHEQGLETSGVVSYELTPGTRLYNLTNKTGNQIVRVTEAHLRNQRLHSFEQDIMLAGNPEQKGAYTRAREYFENSITQLNDSTDLQPTIEKFLQDHIQDSDQLANVTDVIKENYEYSTVATHQAYKEVFHNVIIEEWSIYLDEMNALKARLSVESLGQERDPLLFYSQKAAEVFEQFKQRVGEGIANEIVRQRFLYSNDLEVKSDFLIEALQVE